MCYITSKIMLLNAPATATFGSSSPAVICLYSAAGGVISHLAYFIRGEHHNESFLLFKLILLAPVALTVVQYVFTDIGIQHAALRSVAYTSAYLAALWSSMVIYRVFFHPLRKFPGPTAAKISKLWHVSKVMNNLQNHFLLDRLHHQIRRLCENG